MAAKRGGAAMAGFVLFAGSLLMVIGLINVFEGLIALFSDERVVMTRTNLVVVDVTGWGWTLLISGLLLMAVGAGLLVAQTWARITAIVLVCLHAVVQTAWLGAYPVWALLMIALDTLVLFALTARWADVRERLGGVGEAPRREEEETQLSASEQRTPPTV
ncbi:DUF7144 family membrane protein [Kribbella shirazensis]|uniref:DUF7144 domain-containing protein n=1 Tax=Kribbella shirazensis TaxID=1105143 RepID=A0A7X5VDJ4_9ACTN|nr:hypothetical protein [Kribbella shirazensis]NIK59261.1 hypothetical protein [Kribbella shirazensis]